MNNKRSKHDEKISFSCFLIVIELLSKL